jgi:hypothetical protein
MAGEGVIAFHDYRGVEAAIRRFLKEAWPGVSLAVAFAGQVFAVELGSRGTLRAPVVERAVDSRWHSYAWKLASRPAHSASLFFATLSVMPWLDRFLYETKRRLGASDEQDRVAVPRS